MTATEPVPPARPERQRALVTGASSGIGAATVRRLAQEGWEVLATARRTARLEALAEETGCEIWTADLTDAADVAALADHVRATGPLRALVNNAGGAHGSDPVAEAGVEDWRRMYDLNVLATLRITQELLDHVEADGGGDLLLVTSTAAHDTYPGGGGYVAAKHAERAIATTLRLELVGRPVRVIEIAPGMVRTEEFSLKRLGGDADAAAQVYAGVAEPLVADDVADAIVWSLTRPAHVNVDTMVIRPRAQASNTLVARED
ncbi:SDR family NAD(P)-dependent oxidoreductase [Georgenia muralis]|uniref:NADP-dependent 3-hydroxy acid dehydrogenase YdfG n=1 Tax=Georgenia muralis TaxID=154117 RepID=A0A3N4Z646_9MICO|nr:SDR family NAD(P)-dependent oxidoreductase [Georgenia muralis]RPF27807.1 NADP-dependent 3-hydroxy acid dehydrogenase YdfG [Georgenia muralis]